MISRQVFARIEVHFWSSIIWLISESRLAQRCLRELYLLRQVQPGSLLIAALIWSTGPDGRPYGRLPWGARVGLLGDEVRMPDGRRGRLA